MYLFPRKSVNTEIEESAGTRPRYHVNDHQEAVKFTRVGKAEKRRTYLCTNSGEGKTVNPSAAAGRAARSSSLPVWCNNFLYDLLTVRWGTLPPYEVFAPAAVSSEWSSSASCVGRTYFARDIRNTRLW